MVNNGSSIIESVFSSIIDDRPITSISIVEDPKKVPKNHIVISRTFDQDQDADLWREGSFLKRRITRYLCCSRNPASSGFVIEKILVINDKEIPPIGFSTVYRTVDTEQKAWRKKQICFRLLDKRSISKAITDIIVCYRSLSASDHFQLAGNINGLFVYYKMGNTQSSEPSTPASELYPSLNPSNDDNNQGKTSTVPVKYGDNVPIDSQKTNTLGSSVFGLEGVKFDLSSSMKHLALQNKTSMMPIFKNRTLEDLDKEYNYDFKLENDIIMQFLS